MAIAFGIKEEFFFDLSQMPDGRAREDRVAVIITTGGALGLSGLNIEGRKKQKQTQSQSKPRLAAQELVEVLPVRLVDFYFSVPRRPVQVLSTSDGIVIGQCLVGNG